MHHKAKPEAAKGQGGKHGGRGAKVSVLIRGGLPATRSPVQSPTEQPRPVRDGLNRQESAAAIVLVRDAALGRAKRRVAVANGEFEREH